jgi:putative chitinase
MTRIENLAAFFGAARVSLFGGVLAQGQVDGINRLVKALGEYGGDDPRFWAADLATSYLETDRTMQPIREYGGATYFFLMYDKGGDRPGVAAELGNTEPGDGVKFHGRGDVQVTGRRNYAFWSDRLGLPLVENPDLVLTEPGISARILIEGCRIGSFTGKKHSDFLTPTATDFPNDRRVVNGTDRAAEYGAYCERWLAALEAGGLACVAGA